MLPQRLWLLAAALFMGGLLIACSPEKSPDEPARRPEVAATSGCPDEPAVVTDPANRVGGVLDGDVDGDGAEDSVVLAVASGSPGCEAFVVVSTDDAVLSAPIEQEGLDPTTAPPGLVGLAEVDGRDGNEIIVRLASGASTEFMGLFSAAAGELKRLPVEDGEFGDLFPSGGSVGHLEQSDCGEPGSVVISVAVPRGQRYLLRRAVYSFDGSGFTRQGRSSSRQLIDADELASGEVPGFAAGAPFASCPTD